MCGIFGWQFRPGKQKQLSTYKLNMLTGILALEMSERGNQSHGGLAWTESSATTNPAFFRRMGNILESEDILASLAGIEQCVMHTRRATHGALTVDNCHPFTTINSETSRTITGVHNGVLDNHDALNTLHSRIFEVDSQHIFQHLVENKDLKEISGYGTVVYLDSDTPSRLYMGTFNSGNLCLVRLFDRDIDSNWTAEEEDSHFLGVVWASTKRAIERTCAAANLYFVELNVKDETLYFVENGMGFKASQDQEFKFSKAALVVQGYGSGGYLPYCRTIKCWKKKVPAKDYCEDCLKLDPNKNVVVFQKEEEEDSDYPTDWCKECRTWVYGLTHSHGSINLSESDGTITVYEAQPTKKLSKKERKKARKQKALELFKVLNGEDSEDANFEAWLNSREESLNRGDQLCPDCQCPVEDHTIKGSWCTNCGVICEAALDHKNFVEGEFEFTSSEFISD